jgi:hypothetical protein
MAKIGSKFLLIRFCSGWRALGSGGAFEPHLDPLLLAQAKSDRAYAYFIDGACIMIVGGIVLAS